MKISQLIEYNTSNIFLETYTTSSTETIPIPFSENQSWAYLWITNLKFYSLFSLYAKLREIEIYSN